MCTPPNFNVLTEYTLQQATWQIGPKVESCYRIVHTECNGHFLHIENQATGQTRPCNVRDVVHELPVTLWNVTQCLAELKYL